MQRHASRARTHVARPHRRHRVRGRSRLARSGVLGARSTLTHENGRNHRGAGSSRSAAAPARVAAAHPSRSLVPGPDKPVALALFVVLSIAIFLLALGALPRAAIPHPGAAVFLAEKRPLIAAGGAAAFVAFLVAYLTG